MADDFPCPSLESLKAFQSNKGDAELLSSISNHLQQCATCQQVLSALERETPSPADTQSQPAGSPEASSDPTTRYKSLLSGVQEETVLFPGFDRLPFDQDTRNDFSNRFEILEKIGQGSFASVWRARDHRLKRVVALKQSHAKMLLQHTEQFYLREAQMIAQLEHPGIVAVYDILKQPQSLILVCQYIEGPNLSEHLKRITLSERQVAEFCLQVAEALAHAHNRSIIHRDLKPANILVDAAGQPHVADFGLARNLFESGDGSEIVGTPAYMAPEQVCGDDKQIDQRSDVYALGCILAEMLSGKRPFHGGAEDLKRGGMGRKITSPRSVNPQVSKDLDAICLKALSESPGNRYQSAEEMAEDLKRFLDHRPVRSRKQSWPRTLWLSVRRNPVPALALVLLLAFLAIAWNLPPNVPQNVELVEVLIASEPPGAEMTFIPLDATTGLPRPEEAIPTTTIDHEDEPSQTATLPPGTYLVVAVNKVTFHEVFRVVPSAKRPTVDSPYRHRHFQVSDDGRIVLSPITLNFDAANLTHNMARFEGKERFQVGQPGLPSLAPMDVVVKPYWLDRQEVTHGDFWESLPPESKENALPPNPIDVPQPKTNLSWDMIAHYCERIGKRLPDEWEYEFAATLGGTRTFPWGNGPRNDGPWEIGPVARDEQDRLPTDPVVHGLYSNALEWTSSSLLSNRQLASEIEDVELVQQSRVIKGGPLVMMEQKIKVFNGPFDNHVRNRSMLDRRGASPAVGFRCARSIKPRLKPEDFSRVLTE